MSTGATPPPSVQHCPKCGEEIVRPAREGGMFLRSRYLRLVPATARTPRGTVIGCPGCQAELEVREGRLLLLRKLTPPGASGNERGS